MSHKVRVIDKAWMCLEADRPGNMEDLCLCNAKGEGERETQIPYGGREEEKRGGGVGGEDCLIPPHEQGSLCNQAGR
jgi:hypothetical protein